MSLTTSSFLVTSTSAQFTPFIGEASTHTTEFYSLGETIRKVLDCSGITREGSYPLDSSINWAYQKTRGIYRLTSKAFGWAGHVLSKLSVGPLMAEAVEVEKEKLQIVREKVGEHVAEKLVHEIIDRTTDTNAYESMRKEQGRKAPNQNGGRNLKKYETNAQTKARRKIQRNAARQDVREVTPILQKGNKVLKTTYKAATKGVSYASDPKNAFLEDILTYGLKTIKVTGIAASGVVQLIMSEDLDKDPPYLNQHLIDSFVSSLNSRGITLLGPEKSSTHKYEPSQSSSSYSLGLRFHETSFDSKDYESILKGSLFDTLEQMEEFARMQHQEESWKQSHRSDDRIDHGWDRSRYREGSLSTDPGYRDPGEHGRTV